MIDNKMPENWKTAIAVIGVSSLLIMIISAIFSVWMESNIPAKIALTSGLVFLIFFLISKGESD